MRRAKWLLEKDVFLDASVDRLTSALADAGRDFFWAEYAPFGASMSRPTHHSDPNTRLSEDDCVVVYGSINIARRLLAKNPWGRVWQPTAWMNLKNLECATYYTRWGRHMLVRRRALVTWGMLREEKAFYYDKFSADGAIFVKPNANLKLFTGKVVHHSEFDRFYDVETSCYDIDPEALCVVAEPCQMNAEWRFVVCQGKVITGSQYRPVVKAGFDDSAAKVAAAVAADQWQPDSAYVVDVARSGDEHGLLEIGSVNSAGLYECDARAVVDALSSLAEREYDQVLPESTGARWFARCP